MRASLRILLAFALVATAIAAPGTASAVVDVGGYQAPSVGTPPFNVMADGDSAYVVPTNTFSDNVVGYYLATQDPARASVTEITYKGVTYPITAVIVGTDLTQMIVPGTGVAISSSNASATSNMTFFFDPGTYIEGNHINYTNLSKENVSYVGLERDGDTPKTVFLKTPYPATAAAQAVDCIERYHIMHKNIYIENIVFDGSNKDLLPLGGGNTGIGQNRGEYLFFVTGVTAPGMGSDGFVMKDAVVRNLGKDLNQPGSIFNTRITRKNVVMNFYKTQGQVNVENLRTENVLTKKGYSTIATNQAANVNFKDLTIMGTGSHEQSMSIKMENMDNRIDFIPSIPENSLTLAGELSLPSDSYHNNIWVQDYRYLGLHVPGDWKYAVYNNVNGNTSRPAAMVFKDLPSGTAEFNPANQALLDLRDNTWVVQAGLAQTLTAQITKALDVVGRIAVDNGGPIPPANIKVVAGVDGTIPSFDVTRPTGVTGALDANLYAVATVGALVTSQAMVPVAAGSQFANKLGADDTLTVLNFDFHTNARYTAQETIDGIAEVTGLTDPNEALAAADYPLYSTYFGAKAATFTNSSADMFQNCRFASLVQAIEFDGTTPTQLVTGETAQVAAKLTGDADSYTGAGIAAPNGSADDTAIGWFSSDPTIATVSAAGVVTGVSAGTVTVYAKALDADNGGEIEKPWVMFEVEIVAPLPYTIEYYVDGVYQPSWDVTGSVLPTDAIVTSVTDKLPAGASLDGTASTTLPFTVTETDNVIKVYYKTVEVPEPKPEPTPTPEPPKPPIDKPKPPKRTVVVPTKTNPKTGDHLLLSSVVGAIGLLGAAGMIAASRKPSRKMRGKHSAH